MVCGVVAVSSRAGGNISLVLGVSMRNLCLHYSRSENMVLTWYTTDVVNTDTGYICARVEFCEVNSLQNSGITL